MTQEMANYFCLFLIIFNWNIKGIFVQIATRTYF